MNNLTQIKNLPQLSLQSHLSAKEYVPSSTFLHMIPLQSQPSKKKKTKSVKLGSKNGCLGSSSQYDILGCSPPNPK